MSDARSGALRSMLVRNTRLVPVRPPEAPAADAPPPEPVDIRIVNGVVVEVGARLGDRGEEHLDVDGRWAVPGLWDHHVHSVQAALAARRLDLSGTSGPREVIERVAAHIAGLAGPADSVVHGFGHRSVIWPRPATVAELDAVSGRHPVVLVSGDGHNGWLNSAALSLLGADPREGVLDENDWFPLFGRLGDLPGDADDAERSLAELVRQVHAKGVVGLVDFEFGPGFRDWPRRFAEGLDTLRVRPAVYPERLEEVIGAGLRTGAALPVEASGGGGGLLRMGPLKIISDGSLGTRTAFCHEPYADAAGLDFPRGKQNYSFAEVAALLTRAHGSDLEAAVHAIGDAALGQALDAFAATGARGGIEHAQLIRWEDAPRMARLGLRASMQPAHLLDDRDAIGICWPDRAERCFAVRTMLAAGVTVRLGSDAPVSPLDPWLAMASAVHRSGDGREGFHPEQSMTTAEALGASTDGQGTPAPGSRGDLVLLDADPLADAGGPEAAERLLGIRVAATLVAGRVVHTAL